MVIGAARPSAIHAAWAVEYMGAEIAKEHLAPVFVHDVFLLYEHVQDEELHEHAQHQEQEAAEHQDHQTRRPACAPANLRQHYRSVVHRLPEADLVLLLQQVCQHLPPGDPGGVLLLRYSPLLRAGAHLQYARLLPLLGPKRTAPAPERYLGGTDRVAILLVELDLVRVLPLGRRRSLTLGQGQGRVRRVPRLGVGRRRQQAGPLAE
mmetsp:Transcript_68146/g.208907  ORF Transcript_68146/g.208907 Transcript_68146/m.208907 type:complete len:207 (+) Transcript_68146:953-1573(+)